MHGNSRGLLFPAGMFIGGGIGLAVGQPGPGFLAGMGLGFLAMAVIRLKHEPVRVRVPSTARGYFLLLAGLTLVVAGPALVYRPDIVFPYLVAAFLTLLGAGLLVIGGKHLLPPG